MDWTTTLYALLPHPEQPAILATHTSTGLALPQARLEGQLWVAEVDRVLAALGPACGLPFNVLTCLGLAENEETRLVEALFLLEARLPPGMVDLPPGMVDLPPGMVDLPPGTGDLLPGQVILPEYARWIPMADLPPGTVDHLPESLRDGLNTWLAEREAQLAHGARWQPPALRPDWALPGWYAQAEKWIAAELTRRGWSLQAVEPLKSWAISVVMRANTGRERIFFKASRDLPLFVNEGVVMSALAGMYPEHIAMPLAVEPNRQWMLLGDLGEPVGRNATLDQQAALFETMARLQIDSATRLADLYQAGCLDRRIAWLQAHLAGLLADETVMSPLNPEEREGLVNALPRLRAMLAELDALPIPSALVHGDLHTGNVALRDGKIQIFDWTDAAVTHPFFDLFHIFTEQDSTQRERLETAVCAVWEQAYPAPTVRRALELARVLYGLYHATSYQFIVNHLEEPDRPSLNAAYYFLRQVLAGLKNEQNGQLSARG